MVGAQTSKFQSNKGGWITFPFIMGSLAGMNVASGGWMTNLIIYLIKEFNVRSINATLISNVVAGCINIFPLAAAVIADSFFGSFSVISISFCISLLGIVVLTLTATIDSLRPQPCDNNGSSICNFPSKLQYGILYLGLLLASMGLGGTRFTTAALGANQYDNLRDKNTFFNWFVFVVYSSFVVSSIGVVYLEDNVSWGWGYGICIAANVVGLAVFLIGNRFYRHDKPQGSPFTALARVFVAAVRKRAAKTPPGSDGYYYGKEQLAKMVDTIPTKSLRCLNRAALITEGDLNLDGSLSKPWRLCKVEEVEDLKTLLNLSLIWSSAIFLSTPIAIQSSLTILQALTMDRHLGPNFQIPPGSFAILTLISTCIFLPFIDRFLHPLWQKFIGNPPSPLQRIALGHIFNVLGMVVSAIVESRRLRIAHSHRLRPEETVSMLSLWLFPQLVLVGIGEAFHFPGQVGLYYQEFPASLRSTATTMISLVVAVAYYLSTALIDLLRRVTKWLPDDINEGRLDNVYWIVFVIGVLNFGYFLACAKCYKYQNYVEEESDFASQNQESV